MEGLLCCPFVFTLSTELFFRWQEEDVIWRQQLARWETTRRCRGIARLPEQGSSQMNDAMEEKGNTLQGNFLGGLKLHEE